MTRRFLASVVGAALLLLSVGALTATAADGVQVAGQSATNEQAAGAASGATQIQPSNTNVSVRVLSPGDDGSVSQTNSASSEAKATNDNDTDQDSSQHQGGSGGIQAAGQSAGNAQLAGSLSAASQYGAKNANTQVRVLSPGSNGSVSQSNDVSSSATSRNDNDTDQDAHQSQGGSSCGCDAASGIQTSDQSARDGQAGMALSGARQAAPANADAPTAVGSSGAAGTTSQSNSADSSATSKNDNDTDQDSRQSQAGSGSGIQTSDQSAESGQLAVAASSASQVRPTNTNVSVRVLSPGNDGDVRQSNSVSSTARASNDNSTDQSSHQDQSGKDGSCGCDSGSGIQVAKQRASNEQGAAALSAATQEGATNENVPVRVLSPGNGGSVHQSNSVDSDATARNSNDTDQRAHQSQLDGHAGECGCDGGLGIQVLGQKSRSEQGALAASAAVQDFGRSECGCRQGGNTNEPVRVWSPGDDGSVRQSNSADSSARASNSNDTDQDARQLQAGGSGIAIQALGQQAENGQLAKALSGTFQLHASNTNDPTRVYSHGAGGSVYQSNSADSSARAKNENDTDQDAHQSQHGSGGCRCSDGLQIQALGQSASSWQAAFALSAALQAAPRNASGGTSVWSPGRGGSTGQANDTASTANGRNGDDADQDARQYAS